VTADDPSPGASRASASDASPAPDDALPALAEALVALGLQVRDAVRAGSGAPDDARVVRSEGGDDIFGIDARADEVLLEGFRVVGERFPGRLVMEGQAEPIVVGHPGGPWRFLVDPLDGTRPLLAGKRSAWVLIGAGRGSGTLEELELSVAVEVPTSRAALGLAVWATRDGRLRAVDHDLVGDAAPRRVVLRPSAATELDHGFVTVVRFAPGFGGAIGAWSDELLRGLTVFDDLVPCTAGQMLGLASGGDLAVFDPRPVLAPGSLAAHPYDLAALWVARAAGAVIEALPSGPLDVPLDVDTPVAWQGFANRHLAARLRVRTRPG
jgi:fructose-1,6-bisphosphatase/inositol monophosphatase family enzyme